MIALDPEIEGWLSLEHPELQAELDSTKHDDHAHRKVLAKVMAKWRRSFALEWTGSAVGRTLYIVVGKSEGPDEVSVGELGRALEGRTREEAKIVLLKLMEVKKVMGGGRLVLDKP